MHLTLTEKIKAEERLVKTFLTTSLLTSGVLASFLVLLVIATAIVLFGH